MKLLPVSELAQLASLEESVDSFVTSIVDDEALVKGIVSQSLSHIPTYTCVREFSPVTSESTLLIQKRLLEKVKPLGYEVSVGGANGGTTVDIRFSWSLPNPGAPKQPSCTESKPLKISPPSNRTVTERQPAPSTPSAFTFCCPPPSATKPTLRERIDSITDANRDIFSEVERDPTKVGDLFRALLTGNKDTLSDMTSDMLRALDVESLLKPTPSQQSSDTATVLNLFGRL